jgi:membrane-bound serine protease (ClpP class)
MEVFVIPGFGVAGITGMACIVIGTMLMFQGFILPDPALPWQKEILFMNASRIVGILLISFFLVFLFFRFGLSRLSKVVSGPYLDTTLEQSHADSKESLGANPGDLGIAQSFLRPSGKIKIGGKKFDAITQGEFIEKGTEIEIFKIDGNRIIVRDKNQEET